MVERHRVACATTSAGSEPEQRIARIGGTNTVGVNWRLTQDEAIDGIEGGRWAFFVLQRHGRPVDVVVARTASGKKYLATAAGSAGDDQADLLSLPTCNEEPRSGH